MISDVLRYSIDVFYALRCFKVFSGCSHLLTDVFKMSSDDLRCSDMFSEDHKCWILDFLQIFSRCSLDVLWMFLGFFQDVLKGLVSVVGLGGLVPKPLVV